MADTKEAFSFPAVIEEIKAAAQSLTQVAGGADAAVSASVYTKALDVALQVWLTLHPNPSAVVTAALTELMKQGGNATRPSYPPRPGPPGPRPAPPYQPQPPVGPYG